MNITHLRYAIEVMKTGSISQAAENLFMSQPNLSKTIKEFESSLGYAVFRRTTKGVIPTKKGAELLECGKNILLQIDEMESMYNSDSDGTLRFAICLPRASYIAHAMSRFLSEAALPESMDIDFLETNSVQAIKNVVNGEYSLGIMRCQKEYEKYFTLGIEEHDIRHKVLFEYDYQLLISADDPLAKKDEIDFSDVKDYIEIVHGDISLPMLPKEEELRSQGSRRSKRRISVYERASQLDFLRSVPGTYMWVSPMPEDVMKANGLVQKSCKMKNNCYTDILIYMKDHVFSDNEKRFIELLTSVIEEVKVEK